MQFEGAGDVEIHSGGVAAGGEITYLSKFAETVESGNTEDVEIGTLLENDFCILQISKDAGGSTWTVNSTGWTALYDQDIGGGQWAVYYKFMGATPDTAFNLTSSSGNPGSRDAIVMGHNFRGVHQSTPIHKNNLADGSSGDPNPPSVTTTVDGCFIWICGFQDDDIVTLSAPSGYATNWQAMNTGGGEDGHSAGTGFLEQGTSGAEDPAAFGSSGSDEWVAATVALQPG